MLLTEYNEAKVMELFKEDGRKEGRKEEAHTINSLKNILITSNTIHQIQCQVLFMDYQDKSFRSSESSKVSY